MQQPRNAALEPGSILQKTTSHRRAKARLYRAERVQEFEKCFRLNFLARLNILIVRADIVALDRMSEMFSA
jgi:hypothetical protein